MIIMREKVIIEVIRIKKNGSKKEYNKKMNFSVLIGTENCIFYMK